MVTRSLRSLPICAHLSSRALFALLTIRLFALILSTSYPERKSPTVLATPGAAARAVAARGDLSLSRQAVRVNRAGGLFFSAQQQIPLI